MPEAQQVEDTQAPVQMVRMEQLWVGDRFRVGSVLYTYLERSHSHGVRCIARRHGPQSVALGERGYGYKGDDICGFPVDYIVEFVPPAEA